jgi:hypothetical protein
MQHRITNCFGLPGKSIAYDIKGQKYTTGPEPEPEPVKLYKYPMNLDTTETEYSVTGAVSLIHVAM